MDTKTRLTVTDQRNNESSETHRVHKDAGTGFDCVEITERVPGLGPHVWLRRLPGLARSLPSSYVELMAPVQSGWIGDKSIVTDTVIFGSSLISTSSESSPSITSV